MTLRTLLLAVLSLLTAPMLAGVGPPEAAAAAGPGAGGPLASVSYAAPIAVATANPTSGPHPLLVGFSAAGSADPEGGALAYAWDFQSDGVVDATAPEVSHTYAKAGSYVATLTVTDPEGNSASSTVAITASNRAPTAVASAKPTPPNMYGYPYGFDFSSAGSADPDGDALTYAWDFTSDGVVDKTGAEVQHSYYPAGYYTATLTVDDGQGATSSATVAVKAGNLPPEPFITSPSGGDLFAVGQRITLKGRATDPEEGNLPASSLSWVVLLRHDTHTHPLFRGTGDDITFVAPAPEDMQATTNSYLEIYLTATDNAYFKIARSATVTQNLNPRRVPVTLRVQPRGFAASVNGYAFITEYAFTSWDGYGLNLAAPTRQDAFGRIWTVRSWSDGGAATHTAITPPTAVTYTAIFRRPTTLSLEASSRIAPFRGRVTLSGALATPEGMVGGRAGVKLWKSIDGGRAWRLVRRAPWHAASKTYRATDAPTRNALYQLRFGENPVYHAAESPARLVRVRASLSRPSTPASVEKGVRFTTTGLLKPYHGGTTRLLFQRLEGGEWKLRRTVEARNARYRGNTRYSVRISLPRTGSWRVRAYHADATHAATYSPFRRFTVR